MSEDFTGRAKILITQRSYQEAVRICRRGLLTRPDYVDGRILLGLALLALRRFEEVRVEMLALLRVAPQHPIAHRILGEAYLRAGDVQRAKEALDTATALAPHDPVTRDLMEELAESGTAPARSTTVERWLDPDALATLQTDPPEFWEVTMRDHEIAPLDERALPQLQTLLVEQPRESSRKSGEIGIGGVRADPYAQTAYASLDPDEVRKAIAMPDDESVIASLPQAQQPIPSAPPARALVKPLPPSAASPPRAPPPHRGPTAPHGVPVPVGLLSPALAGPPAAPAPIVVSPVAPPPRGAMHDPLGPRAPGVAPGAGAPAPMASPRALSALPAPVAIPSPQHRPMGQGDHEPLLPQPTKLPSPPLSPALSPSASPWPAVAASPVVGPPPKKRMQVRKQQQHMRADEDGEFSEETMLEDVDADDAQWLMQGADSKAHTVAGSPSARRKDGEPDVPMRGEMPPFADEESLTGDLAAHAQSYTGELEARAPAPPPPAKSPPPPSLRPPPSTAPPPIAPARGRSDAPPPSARPPARGAPAGPRPMTQPVARSAGPAPRGAGAAASPPARGGGPGPRGLAQQPSVLVSEELTSGDLLLEQSAEIVLPTIKRSDPAPVPPSPLSGGSREGAAGRPRSAPPPPMDPLAARRPAPQASAAPAMRSASGPAQPQRTLTPHPRSAGRRLDPTYVPSARRAKIPIFVIVLGAVAAIGLGVGSVLVVRTMGHTKTLETAMAQVAEADKKGTRADIDRALSLLEKLDDEPARAARARLLAMLALEHGERAAADRAQRAWGELEPETRRTDDATLAQAALALTRFNSQQATDLIGQIGNASPRWAEATRMSAIIELVAGNIDSARRYAELAAAAQSGSPRHESLAAVVQAFKGETEVAVARLARVPDHASYPAVRIARARINLFSGRSPSDAASEAQAVLEGPLASAASPPERAWARLVRAWFATSPADRTRAELEGEVQSNPDALALVRRARDERPLNDEHFRLVAAEVLLRLGQFSDAQSEVNARPGGDITAGFLGQRRATLLVLAALAEGNRNVAEAAIGRLPANDGTTAFLRGRLEEMHDRSVEARANYAAAVQRDPRLAEIATLRLATIDIANGNIQQADEALSRLIQRNARGEIFPRPSVQLASMCVRTHVAVGQLERAQQVLDAAKASAPGDVRLAIAEAELGYANGAARWPNAATVLDNALRDRPDDVQLLVARGELARRTGDTTRARQIFEGVLQRVREQPDALLGIAAIESATTRLAQAAEVIGRAERARATPARLELERARLLVAQGRGGSALRVLERVAARSQRDPDVLALLGRAYLQAEQRNEAKDRFNAALRLDPENPESLLGLANISPIAQSITFGEPRRSTAFGTVLRRAETAGTARSLGGFFTCRVEAARARQGFEWALSLTPVDEAMTRAFAAHEQCGAAFVVRAIRAEASNADASEHWLNAARSTVPPARALAMAARASSAQPAQACAFAQQYLETAPAGDAADAMRQIRTGCPGN